VNGATWYRSPTTPFRSYLRIPFEELLPKFELIANPLLTWIERAANAIAGWCKQSGLRGAHASSCHAWCS
jgi:hypothetical protein